MRTGAFLTVLLLLSSTVAFPQKKEKSNFPEVIVQARYVYVTAMAGNQFNPLLRSEDRQAVSNIETAVQKWRRYRLVFDPREADFTILVRRGNQASAGTGTRGGVGTPGVTIGTIATAETGMPDDALMIVKGGADPLDQPSLWRRTERNGLDAPALSLFQQFRKEVEKAAGKKP